MRSTRAAWHWLTWVLIALIVVFTLVLIGGVIRPLFRSAPARTADQFIERLLKREYRQAQALLSNTIPKNKRDVRKAWETMLRTWGPEEMKIEPIEEYRSPRELKHPQAARAVRLEYEVQGYYAKGYIAVYVVPEGDGWRVVEYLFD